MTQIEKDGIGCIKTISAGNNAEVKQFLDNRDELRLLKLVRAGG